MAGWTCGGCSGANPDGTLFCGHCGTRQVSAADGWSCRECGAANPADTGFCGRCGAQRGIARQEELRLVTALFADISGFTTLADTLDIESLHDVINPLIAGLATIAEKYGGYIEKYAGDALLVVYGAPVTHEDDPQRALLAALDMHAALPRLLAEIGPAASELTIHVGVNTGRVVAGRVGSEQQSDFSVLGDSVILAQRLESVCPPGETYVGATTYELTKDEFDFESVGELQLKGKLTTVEGFRLVGRKDRRVAAAGRPLVGRERELSLIDGALAAAITGETVVLTVTGEAGTGKSRLLASAQERATARGVRWLSARCLSYGSTMPYWPLADLVRRILDVHLEDDPLVTTARLAERLPDATVPAALRLLGLHSEQIPPEQARRQVHDGVAEWLRLLCSEEPVVLLVEDLHWIDAATLDLLAEIVRTTRGLPLALIVSARPEAADRLAVLASSARRRDVALRPLAPAALGEMVANILGTAPAPGLLRVLTERTSGNALFVEELTRSLAETDALALTSDGWDVSPDCDLAAVPGTVERVFAARLDALPPDAVNLLQTASVIGRSTRLSLLRAVASGQEIAASLDVLLAAGLLDPADDGVTFHHALLQDVVYGRLLRKRRRELHRQVADAGRRLYGDGDETVELLARHLYLADAGEEAVQPLLRAGRRAAAVYANDQAVIHLGRALEVLTTLGDGSERRLAVELELADLHLLRGDYAAAELLYRAAMDRGDDAAAWAGMMATERAKGSYARVIELFSRASGRFDPRDSRSVPLWLECANTLALMSRFSDAISLLRTQLRLLPPDETVLRGRLLSQLAFAEGELRLPGAVPHAEQAVELLDRPESLRQLVTALRVAGTAHLYAGDRQRARQQLERGVDVAERIGLLEEAAGCLLNNGLLLLDDSAAQAAESYRQALQRFERLGRPTGVAQAYGNLAEALLLAGELAEAHEAVGRALELGAQLGHRLVEADATCTLARIQLATDDARAAVDTAESAADCFLALADPDVANAEASLRVAEQAAALAGDADRARALAARAQSLVEASAAVGSAP